MDKQVSMMELTHFIIAMILWDIVRSLGIVCVTIWLTARKVKKDREEEQKNG